MKEEYGRAVYCNEIDSGPMQSGIEEPGGTDGDAMVGTGGN